jgi:hypothetical protein
MQDSGRGKMTSVVRQRLPIIVAMMGFFVLPGPSPAQEEQACEQHRPREGTYSAKARDYVDRAREEENPQDKRGYYAFALRQLQEGMEADPDNPNYILMAGQISLELDDYVAADTLWERAACMWEPYVLRINGLRTVAWSDLIERANEFLSAGETAVAMDLYSEAYTINDREPHRASTRRSVESSTGPRARTWPRFSHSRTSIWKRPPCMRSIWRSIRTTRTPGLGWPHTSPCRWSRCATARSWCRIRRKKKAC